MRLKIYHSVKEKYLKDFSFFRAEEMRMDLELRDSKLINVAFHSFGYSASAWALLHTSGFLDHPISLLGRSENTQLVMGRSTHTVTWCPVVRCHFLLRPRSKPGTTSPKAVTRRRGRDLLPNPRTLRCAVLLPLVLARGPAQRCFLPRMPQVSRTRSTMRPRWWRGWGGGQNLPQSRSGSGSHLKWATL